MVVTLRPIGALTHSLFVRLTFLPVHLRPAFQGMFILASIQDFLDGRVCLSFGYLQVEEDGHTYLDHFTTTDLDLVRQNPSLSHYCFAP